MKRKIIILVLAILTMLAITIPVTLVIIRHNEAETARFEEEMIFRRGKFAFARNEMRFWHTFPPYRIDDEYIEVLFVHSEEESEALDLPDYVLVMWPTDHTLATLIEVNNTISRSEIDLSEFGLTYPITIDDTIYNWELIRNLYGRGFSNNDIRRIWDYIPIHLQTIREEAAREEEHDNEY